MNDPFVTVEQFEFLPEAQAVRMHMESEGFQAQLLDAETVSTDWALGNAIGYIKLQVPRSQADAALVILEKLRALKKSRRETDAEELETTRCLSCGEELHVDQTTCPKCGWSYAADGDTLINDEEQDEDAAGDGPAGRPPAAGMTVDEPISVLDSLRSWKKPMVWLLLFPMLAGAALFVISLILFLLKFPPPF